MTYYIDDFDTSQFLDFTNMGNRLFCTFATEQTLENTLGDIQNRYSILYNKIFILYSKQQQEYAITYNVDLNNISGMIPGTILVHRKKDTKTLYTINALNQLIRELNDGILDEKYAVNWENYRNCILLTRGPELRRVPTQLHRIVEVV